MREISQYCPVREFCNTYNGSDPKMTPLDIPKRNDTELALTIDCMTINGLLFNEAKCPMLQILLHRSEKLES